MDLRGLAAALSRQTACATCKWDSRGVRYYIYLTRTKSMQASERVVGCLLSAHQCMHCLSAIHSARCRIKRQAATVQLRCWKIQHMADYFLEQLLHGDD